MRVPVWALAALILAASPALAQEAPSVTTRATARDRLPNTVADVQVGIEARGKTVAEVQAALAAGSGPLLAYLGPAGAERVQTLGVNVRPELDAAAPGRASRIVGYAGRVSVGFQIEAGKLGTVLTEVLGRGATTIDAASLHPRHAEVEGARNRLAAAATKAALEQARVVAEAAGRRAGALQSIEVDAMPAFPRPLMSRAAVAAPIASEAGDSEVNAGVTVRVRLEP